MHRLLQRQLQRHFGLPLAADLQSADALPKREAWLAFVQAVDAAYEEADADRALLERSMELTSQELIERNEQLRLHQENLEALVRQRTADLERRTQQIQVAAEAGRLLTAQISQAGAIDAALNLAARIGAAHSYVLVVGPGDQAYFKGTVPGLTDMTDEQAREFGRAIATQGLERWVLENKQPALVADSRTDPRWLANWPTAPEHVEEEPARAVISVPLFGARQALTGVLAYTHPTPGHFNAGDLQVVELIGRYLAVALDNGRLFGETVEARRQAEARAEELAVLTRVTAAATSVADLTAALRAISRELVLTFNARNTGIALFNADRSQLTVVADYSASPDEPSAIGVVIPVTGNPSTLQVIETGRSLVVPEVETNPLTAPIHDLMRQRRTQCLMIIPLLARGEVIGTIGVDSVDVGRVFTPAEVALTETIAGQIANAVESARLYTDLQRERERLLLANEIGRALVAEVSVEGAVDVALSLVPRLGGAADANVLVLGPGDAVHFKGTAPGLADLSPEAAHDFGLAIATRGLARWVLDRQAPALVTDSRTDPRWYTAPQHEAEEPARAVICVPLLGLRQGRSGTLTYTHPTPGHFDEQDARLAELVARYLATAINNAALFDELQAALAETRRLAQREHTIAAITDRIHSATEVRSVLRIAAEELRRATGSARAVVRLGGDLDRSPEMDGRR